MKEQVAAIGDVAEMELAAMREDVQASIEQGHAVREAARAQNQPIVFAYLYVSYAGRYRGRTIARGAKTITLGHGQLAVIFRLTASAAKRATIRVSVRFDHEVTVVSTLHRRYGEPGKWSGKASQRT
jgi:hypothetical protein